MHTIQKISMRKLVKTTSGFLPMAPKRKPTYLSVGTAKTLMGPRKMLQHDTIFQNWWSTAAGWLLLHNGVKTFLTSHWCPLWCVFIGFWFMQISETIPWSLAWPHFFRTKLLSQPNGDFFSKNLNQLVIFVIGLAFTWSWVNKNRAQFLENELLQKIKLSKNGFIISCSPNLIIFTETKIKMIKLIFDIENWLWKSNFGDFC